MESWKVRVLLEILHKIENGHCMECPDQAYPCRTIQLMNIALDDKDTRTITVRDTQGANHP